MVLQAFEILFFGFSDDAYYEFFEEEQHTYLVFHARIYDRISRVRSVYPVLLWVLRHPRYATSKVSTSKLAVCFNKLGKYASMNRI